MKFEGLTPHSSVGVQTKLITCLIYQNKSVSKHTWNDVYGYRKANRMAKQIRKLMSKLSE